MARLSYYTTATALAILFLLPLLWSGWASFNGPEGLGVDNYGRLFTSDNGIRPYHVVNSVLVCLITVGGTLLISTLGGYAFGRFRFPGRDLLFLVTLAILMVPYATILIALYVLLGWLGLQDSLLGLGLVLIMFQLPFSIFMMRNSFEAVPRELEESALIDGCNSFGVLTRVMLHAVRPGLITAVPCVLLFLFLQRSYVRGFLSGALKG